MTKLQAAVDTLWSWRAWDLDLRTWGWIFWLGFFFLWEGLTLYEGAGEELTEHLRPLFLAQPVTWFLALGLWLWIGVHFLAPAGEAFLRRLGSV